MKLKNLIIMSLFFLTIACNTENKFDKMKWLQKSDVGQYPNRNNMVNDLVDNYKLKGLSYKQLVELIGDPEKKIIEVENEI